MTRPASAFIAVCALASSIGAQAAPKFECLSREEIAGLATVVLPAAIDAVADKCQASLPADAYLLTGAKARGAELRALRDQAMPQAKRAFLKFGNAGEADPEGMRLMEALPDDTLLSLLETSMVAEMLEDVKPGSCGDVDRIARPLAPLPADNLIALISELFLVGTREDEDIRGCPA